MGTRKASPADHVLLQNQVVALLRSHALQTVRFVVENVTIGHQSWSGLADLVLADQLHLDVDPGLTGRHLVGEYYPDGPDANTLKIAHASLATIRDKSSAVHELAHAAVDLLHLPHRRGLHRTEAEAIAYIAQCVYSHHLHTNPLHGHLRLGLIADAIARRIVAAEPHLYYVTHDEIRSLRNAIGHHRHYRRYRGTLAPSDGIP
jgi:hypothetical protein